MIYLYIKATGKILQSMTCQLNQIKLFENSKFSTIISEQVVTDTSHYVDDLKNLVELPVRPSKMHSFNYATKQWELKLPVLIKAIKQRRKELLDESDWTQVDDCPAVTKTVWREYRQALRNITEQNGYPLNIVWPIKPEA